MVIGKSGASIKEIRETTGVSIQVYPKAGSEEAKQSVERVITVGAEQNHVLLDAIQRVLEKVAADPLHAQEAQKQEFNSSTNSFAGFGNQRVESAPQFNNMPAFNSNTPVWQSQTNLGMSGLCGMCAFFYQLFSNILAPQTDNSYAKTSAAYPPGPIKYNGIPVLNNTEVSEHFYSIKIPIANNRVFFQGDFVSRQSPKHATYIGLYGDSGQRYYAGDARSRALQYYGPRLGSGRCNDGAVA